MNTNFKRSGAAALATALAATTRLLGPGGSELVGAASATFTCTGVEGDTAGSVGGAAKSSKQLLELLATLGGSAQLSLPVDVTATAPASVQTGSGPYTATFDYTISLPTSLVTSVKTLLGLDKISVTNASFAVEATGAATASLVGTTTSSTVSLATAPVTISQKITGPVTPSTSGLVYYRPGATKLSVVVNGEVAGSAKIGTITVSCAATGLLGSTAVKPAGAPNIPANPIAANAQANTTSSINLDDGTKVLADDGNPIDWSTLRTVGNPSGGAALAAGRSINYTAPATNGTYDVTFEVCAAPKTIKGTDGLSEVQTLRFSDPSYYQQSFNKHPIYFTLTFDGQETAPITTSFFNNIFGVPVPYDANDETSRFFHDWFGQFAAPSPATVQAALEALPNVGPGDIVVSGGPTATDLTAPYTFTFAGALAHRDVAQIGIGKWVTWLPAESLAQILGAAKGLGGSLPTVAPPTFDQLLQSRLAGQITDDQFFAGWGDRVKYDLLSGINVQEIIDQVTSWFPKTPTAATTVSGEAPIPDTTTGPLCSQGVIQFAVTGGTTPTTAPTTAAPASVEGISIIRTQQAAAADPVQGTVRFAG